MPDTLAPLVSFPIAGTPGFLGDGDLVVLERRWEVTNPTRETDWRVLAHQFKAGTWESSAPKVIKGLKGSPLGCAVSPAGDAIAAGYKTVKLLSWPDAKKTAGLKGVKYQLERDSIGFSPSGATLSIADGGYITPANRWVRSFRTEDGSEFAKIKTDTFAVNQVLMPDESCVLLWALRHNYEYGSKTDPQHLLACYDIEGASVRWLRRYWAKPHRMAYDANGSALWTTGEIVSTSEGQSHATTQNLEEISLDDGTTTRVVKLPELAAPTGALCATQDYVVAAWRNTPHDTGGVFAVHIESGALTRLTGAGRIYAASDHAGRHVALSSAKAGTTIFQLP